MGVKLELNQKYAQLCQELGDLIFKTELNTKRIDEIKKEIEVLNLYAPALEQIEQDVVQDERKKK